jgi:sterol desaturase/sphingolipid hydroxylase (fatty acid hydroxylase superfamily)
LVIFLFDLCYRCRWLDRYKSNKNKAWPFLENPQLYQNKIKQTYTKYYTYLGPVFFVFILVSNPILSMLDTDFDTIPPLLYCYLQANSILIIGDGFFYIAHRILHTGMFYKYHKDHHSYINLTVHSRLESSLVDYLAETICYGIISLGLFELCGIKTHLVTYIIFLFTGMCIDILDHSGYQFPVSPFHIYLPLNELLFGTSIHKYHEIHHNKTRGNYASVSLIYDWCFNTRLT